MRVSTLRVLFLGGTGTISSGVAPLAVASDIDLTLVTRGQAAHHSLPEGARHIQADARDPHALRSALGNAEWDVVVDWLAFTPDHVREDMETFTGRTGQYVFISSASAYQKPPRRLPIIESTPLRNPFSGYARGKIACEDLLTRAYREHGFPMTIIRPSHTYSPTATPFGEGWTVVERMRRGAEIVIHGDGTSLWTLTHNKDFARGLVPLLGNTRAIGEAIQIMSDDVLTWNQIATILADAAGAPEPRIVHVPSDAIAAADAQWGESLIADKAHSAVFDSSKLRSLVPGWRATIPFEQGAREMIEWYDADPARQGSDPVWEARIDDLVERFRV